MGTQTTVSTDAQDYAPGAWAEITATGFDPGSTVTFQVQHASDPGADGVWGTMDDVTVDLGGDGHETWSIEDGSALDLDGAVNGSIVTSWYVNPDDSMNWHFLLTAMAVNQQTASAGFTDSAGSYTLKWYASDPSVNSAPYLPTYEKLSPVEYLARGFAYPVGRADLDVTNPLDNAVAYGPTFSTNNLDAVTSLAPKDMALGQIVPFQMEIKVTGSTAPENGVITFTTEWLAKTTSGGNFGFDTHYKVIAAFVDTGDVGFHDSGALATLDQFTSTVVGAGTSNEAIQGTFQVSGLDSGDNIIVEMWVVLDDVIPVGVTGNVQTSLVSARTGIMTDGGNKISTGNQTVPLLKVQDFFASNADLSVIKSDSSDAGTNGTHLTNANDIDPVGLKPGDTFTYTILATNNSTNTVANSITVVDTLDPSLEFVSATSGGTFNDNGASPDTVTWSLTSLSQGESQLLYVTVKIKDSAPTSGTADLLNSVSITAITADSDLANNTNTEATDLISLVRMLRIEKSASLADGGEKADSTNDVINYLMEVTNQGNAAISGVTVTDAFTTDEAPVLVGGYNQGDTNQDGLLDVGETWLYKASHQVTQAELDAGVAIVNTAVVTGTGATSDDDTASVEVQRNPALQIEKQVSIDGGSTWFDADSATGPVANVGQTVYFRVVVMNSGNVTLSNIDVQDQVTAGTGNPLDFTFGAESEQLIKTLASGEVVISRVIQVQALSGQQTDLATAFTTDAGSEVKATDYANYFGKAPTTALIAPTSTTVNQYLNGSALSFQKYYDFQGGVIQYSASLKTGKIAQTNPGVLFYFTGATGSIKVADGNTTEKLSVTIDQTVTLKSGAPITSSLSAVQNNIQLYQVVDANGNGKYDAGETVNTLSSKSYSVTMLNGDITLNFTGTKGSFYVASVKYDTSAVVGASVGKNAATWPTVNYQFDTVFKSATIETYAGGVDLAPKKPAPMLLQGDLGDGAKAVNDAQIKHVVDVAICWWEDHGITAEQLAQLKAATVEITELGHDAQGWWLGASAGTLITIDDDAADHGWSLGLEGVAHNKVDLFSVLVHEMGHVLGKSDEDMGSTLAVGERMLPEILVTPPEGGDSDDDQDAGTDEDHGDDQMTGHTDDHAEDHPDDHSDDHPGDHVDHGVPTIEHMLTLVGSATAEQQMHLHMS